MSGSDVNLRLEEFLDFIIEYQHKGTTSTTENVGEGALEESTSTLRLGDRRPAVDCVLVQDFALGTTRLHHHTPTYRVEGIRDDTGDGGDDLFGAKTSFLMVSFSITTT